MLRRPEQRLINSCTTAVCCQRQPKEGHIDMKRNVVDLLTKFTRTALTRHVSGEEIRTFKALRRSSKWMSTVSKQVSLHETNYARFWLGQRHHQWQYSTHFTGAGWCRYNTYIICILLGVATGIELSKGHTTQNCARNITSIWFSRFSSKQRI